MKKFLLSMAVFSITLLQAQVTIGTGTAVDSNAGLSTPISNWYATSLAQFIYLGSEINASGNITSIQFKLNNTTVLATSNDMIDVWIGHTAKSSYTPVVSATGADWIPISGQTQVMANGSLVQSGTTATFTFSTPFAYNGTDNLVITIDANEPGNDGSGVLWLQTAASPNIMSLMIRTDVDADNANPASPPLNYTGTFTATSVQAKNTRPIVTLQGLTPLSIDEHAENQVAIYPNPVKSTLFIKSQSSINSVEIFNIAGQLVKTDQSPNAIDVSALPTGVYLIKGSAADGSAIAGKFVKE
jgi:hypothetical protein